MELDGEMKLKTTYHNERAVAGVIEALLIVALFSVVLGAIQIYYIPDIMEQREAEHMDQVSNQLSTVKSMIDIQSMTQSTTPISTMITLGTRELPYLVSARSFGDLAVRDEAASRIRITDAIEGFTDYKLTSIVFEAANSYYIDQDYILEGGGMIISQSNENSVMRVDPALTVENATDVTVTFDIPYYVGISGRNHTNGYGKTFIRTNYSDKTSDSFTDVQKINISTDYPDAWNDTLSAYFEDTMTYRQGDSYVECTKNTGKAVKVSINKYTIFVQIGMGWIK